MFVYLLLVIYKLMDWVAQILIKFKSQLNLKSAFQVILRVVIDNQMYLRVSRIFI